jgi:hypothetical protein
VKSDAPTPPGCIEALNDGTTAADVALLRSLTLDHWLHVASEGDSSAGSSYLALEAQLEEMRSSMSWRVTAPLRLARKWLR